MSYAHKRIVQAHHGNDEDVHGERKPNDEHVEPHQLIVFSQAQFDKIVPDDAHEEEV
jgi:hypothetical protein